MKVYLLHRDRDLRLDQPLVENEQALSRDLDLVTLFNAMAQGDKFVFDVVRKVILSPLMTDLDGIAYRQGAIRDSIRNPSVIRELYALASEAIEQKRRYYFGIGSYFPSSTLHGAVDILQMFVEMLRRLVDLSSRSARSFESEAFRRFFAMIDRELDEDYFRELRAHLERLKFKRGVLASAELGKGNVGHNYVLRRWQRDTSRWWNRLFDQGPPTYWFHLHPRDEAGAQALGQLRNRVISRVATAAAQSADHVLSFFQVMKTEFAFLLGCVNLYERLAEKGEPICFPSAAPQGEYRLTGAGLYDACLALRTAKRVVGNELNGDKVRLVIITGANQGGKSTFLRAIGLAQILMQVGMFVPATAFTADVRDRLFTHFRREEDTAMEHGKLDEELRRMSDIVDRLTPASMVLCNESFGATNEREGSEIARQIVSALLEHDVKVAFVTHLTHFARGLFEQGRTGALFLRAERGPNGTRTFTLIPGEPLDTGYGQDLYREVFAA